MNRFIRSFVKILKQGFRKLGLRNTIVERRILEVVYASPRLKRFVFGTRRDQSNLLIHIRELFLNFDHDQLCSFQTDSRLLTDFLDISEDQKQECLALLARAGFVVNSQLLKNPHLNFRVQPISDYYLDTAVFKIGRDETGYVITLHDSYFYDENFEVWSYRILAVMRGYAIGVEKILERNMALQEVPYFFLEITDGATDFEKDLGPSSNVYTFCRNVGSSNIGLLPDAYILHDIAYEEAPKIWASKEEAKLEYENRVKKIFWRGATTGREQHSIRSNRRIQFCLRALQYPDSVDAKITHVVQFGEEKNRNKIYSQLRERGVTSIPVTEGEFGRYTTFVDLEGNTCAWGSFRKYLLLVHVIRPLSAFEISYYSVQSDDSYTAVKHESEIFEHLEKDPSFIDDFEVAWRGYNFALDYLSLIAQGQATIFPN